MKKTKVVLSFPPTEVEEPITYHLIKDYGLMVNILRATIDFGKEGQMVVEISGEDIQISEGFAYLKSAGVSVEQLAEEIQHIKDRCSDCTACVPICPTGALVVDRESWRVSYDAERCVVCLSCEDACPYNAIVIHLHQGQHQPGTAKTSAGLPGKFSGPKWGYRWWICEPQLQKQL